MLTEYINSKKITISIILIVIILAWAGFNLRNEFSTFKPYKKVKIEDVTCARRDFIRYYDEDFDFKIRERIYLSDAECKEVQQMDSIELQMNEYGEIRYSDERFNDNQTYEITAVIILSSFLIGAILYFQLFPALKKK